MALGTGSCTRKIICIESCRDPDQTVDVLTKPLARPKHQKNLKEMGQITI